MPTAMYDPTPDWLKPENASVLDSQLVKLLRAIVNANPWPKPLQGVLPNPNPAAMALDPQSQVLALMGADVPSGGPRIQGYHGSKHDFERFDSSKIGTGQGAQSYGHGMYIAEHPGTAESYRADQAGHPEIKNLKLGTLQVGQHNGFDYSPKGNSLYENIRSSLAEDLLVDQRAMVGTPPDQVQAHVLKVLDDKIRDYATEWPEGVPAAQRLRADLARRNAVSLTFGVAIHADPTQFLDWDKPVSEQPHVQAALAPHIDALRKNLTVVQSAHNKNNWLIKIGDQTVGASNTEAQAWKNAEAMLGDITDPEFTGRDAYQLLSRIHAKPGAFPEIGIHQPAVASQKLREAGIPGNKYLDQDSRAVGAGTSNYVVFPGNEGLIDILRKFGLLLPAAGAANYGGLFQQSQEAK
jgi:hypothetical protein